MAVDETDGYKAHRTAGGCDFRLAGAARVLYGYRCEWRYEQHQSISSDQGVISHAD